MDGTRTIGPLDPDRIAKAIVRLKLKIDTRLKEKGNGQFAGPHEVLGIVTEEYLELTDAVTGNDREQCRCELIDIAVGCIIGVASL